MRWLGKGGFKLFREQMGFTLIEVLLTIFILGFIGAGFLTALNTNARATRTLDEQVVATNLATAHFEAISKSDYDDTEQPPYYDDVVADITIPAPYDVDYSVSFSADGHTWVDTYSGQTLQKITVFVSREEKPVLSICTFKAKKG